MSNLNENLLIYQKYLELIYYTNDLVRKFPKQERFVLVQEIKQNMYAGLKNLLFAQKEYNLQNRIKYLNILDVNLNILKVHIRVSYKSKYISTNNYSAWSSKITDICNLLGAWIKSCQKR